MTVPDKPVFSRSNRPSANDKRRVLLQRMTSQRMASLDDTLASAVGQSNRERLLWSGLLAMPLLFPVALPGMASAVGAFSLLIAYGLLIGRPMPLPDWLADRSMPPRARKLLESAIQPAIRIMSSVGRPRILSLSDASLRVVNGAMLSAAALAMMVPVPVITFDNVLPAMAIVLISWGLRFRDGLMLMAGYLFTLLAIASVVFLWWGGAFVASELMELAGFGLSAPHD